MCTIMEDPVILPSSQMTIDRATIMSVLLSDSHDPFNRAPLTLDMVVPSTLLILTTNLINFRCWAQGKDWSLEKEWSQRVARCTIFE